MKKPAPLSTTERHIGKYEVLALHCADLHDDWVTFHVYEKDKKSKGRIYTAEAYSSNSFWLADDHSLFFKNQQQIADFTSLLQELYQWGKEILNQNKYNDETKKT